MASDSDDGMLEWLIVGIRSKAIMVRTNDVARVKRRAKVAASERGASCRIEIHLNGDRMPSLVGDHFPGRRIKWIDVAEEGYPATTRGPRQIRRSRRRR